MFLRSAKRRGGIYYTCGGKTEVAAHVQLISSWSDLSLTQCISPLFSPLALTLLRIAIVLLTALGIGGCLVEATRNT